MSFRAIGVVLATAATMGLSACATTTRSANAARSIAACGWAPHCVSSINAPGSSRHVDPIMYSGSREQAQAALINAIKRDPDARIEAGDLPTLRVTYRSTVGFVDEVTLAFGDSVGSIDVKSRSRIGFYDFGVNRRRMDALREAFNQEMAATTAERR